MMVKLIGSGMILIATTVLGIMFAKIKIDRVKQLRALISALNMMEIEIKFALNVLPDAFFKISKTIDEKIGQLFAVTAKQIIESRKNACEAWHAALEQSFSNLCLDKEDKEILLALGSSLGEVDTENQIKNIRLIIEQLKRQELKAEEDKARSEKLFKSLGVLSGLTIVIVLF